MHFCSSLLAILLCYTCVCISQVYAAPLPTSSVSVDADAASQLVSTKTTSDRRNTLEQPEDPIPDPLTINIPHVLTNSDNTTPKLETSAPIDANTPDDHGGETGKDTKQPDQDVPPWLATLLQYIVVCWWMTIDFIAKYIVPLLYFFALSVVTMYLLVVLVRVCMCCGLCCGIGALAMMEPTERTRLLQETRLG